MTQHFNTTLIQKSLAAGNHTEAKKGNKKKRESVHLDMFSQLSVGSNGSFSSQQTKGTQTGFASKTIATHLHQEEGVGSREKIQMEAAHRLRTHFPAGLYTEKKPEGGKWKTEGKVLWTISGEKNSVMLAERKFPLANRKGFVGFQVTLLCQAFSYGTIWGSSNSTQYHYIPRLYCVS